MICSRTENERVLYGLFNRFAGFLSWPGLQSAEKLLIEFFENPSWFVSLAEQGLRAGLR